MKLSRLWKFRTALGPVEQAQVVASVVVVVSLATIVSIRVFTYGNRLDWLLFGSVTSVGVLGFINVLFTLKYGQQLEEQKRELMALNTIAEAVNRSVGMKVLLRESIREIRRLLDVDYGWIYHMDGGRLILRAAEGAEPLPRAIIEPDTDIESKDIQWVGFPRSRVKPRSWESKEEWTYGGIGSWASVPIIMKDKFAGAIVVASIERKAILQKQLNLMEAFSNQIGVALENATLFEQLRKSEERYMDLFEHSPDMYHIVNRQGIIISCNQTEADRLGYRKDELVGHSLLTFYAPENRVAVQSLVTDVFENHREVSGHEQQFMAKGGEIVDVSVSTSIVYDESRKPAFIRIVARDITEKKKLESKIFHAQRIDSIGNLAGGIAHDFNNILTSILGSTAIMKRKMRKNNQWYHFADIIETAAKRGAGLTRQLLTFARKSTPQFRPIIVNDIIEETLRLFERSTDKSIAIKKELTNDLAIIKGDDGQLQQAILNLLINARDAMPNGGTITIRSQALNPDIRSASVFGDARAGEFASVAIRDVGAGMSQAVQQRIFEPFFTTKDKGTGLGLSVVYGVVNSHGGFITVQSEVDKGSQFTMFFPLVADREKFQRSLKEQRLRHGSERILVVDDEEHVREMICRMLQTLGHDVDFVESGQEAIDLVEKKESFDLVILDMNMPTMSGKETFFKLKEIEPDLRVVISTGYSNASLEPNSLNDFVDGFLQKPYQMEELSKVLRDVFDEKRE
ncbi:MAG: PAS domain S-box protein [Ignavibacteriales bacterium]|nr:PAS domain S-box protein [Ignavibacteriales bacterium]